MSFTYGGINTDDLEGVEVTPITYPNMGGLQLDIVETPGRDGRFYGGSRMTTSQLPFRVTISGDTQQQADLRRLAFMRMLDPSTGARSLRLDNTANWHYPQAVVAQQIEWEKHADRSKVIYDGEVVFETNFDAAMRQIEPSTVTGSGVGQIEFIADMGSTVSYPTVIFESGGDIRVRVNEFIVDLYDTPPDTYGVLNWDEYKFYTADADLAQSILYEWEGEPHESPSVKSVGGEIVGRNLATNPSFEESTTSGWSFGSQVIRGSGTTLENRVVAGQRSTIFSWNAGASEIQTIAQTDAQVEPGQWVAISGWVTGASSVNLTYVAGIISERNANGTNHLRHHYLGDYESSGTSEMTRFEYVVQVNHPDVAVVRAGFRFSDAPGSSFSGPPESYGYLDGVHIAVADSEQDALAQVEHYFDGDSIGHIVPGDRISSLVNAMSHFERPAIYPGDSVEVEVTPIGSNTATPVIVYPNHRRL